MLGTLQEVEIQELVHPHPMKLARPHGLPQGAKLPWNQSPVHSQTQGSAQPLKHHSLRLHGVKCPSLPAP